MKNPATILIVDDNPDDVFITKRAISKSRDDCEVEVAFDGFQAIERLVNGKPPALVLLDIKMPGAGGIEILQSIRAHQHTQYIPVVMLTSSKMEQDLKASYDSKANSFLHKTHDLSEFTDTMASVLHYWIDLNLSLGN